MAEKALLWFRKGRKSTRLAKVLGIMFVLYWLISYASTAFKTTEWIVMMAILAAFGLWSRFKQIANLRKADMEEIDRMEGTEFENRMVVYFQDLGWKASGTPNNDYGADAVVTRPDGKKIVVQCKRYSDKVPIDAVQEAVAAVRFYKADIPMVITNSHLTEPAKNLARANDVVVWEREQLAASLASVGRPKWPLWQYTKNLFRDMFRRRTR